MTSPGLPIEEVFSVDPNRPPKNYVKRVHVDDKFQLLVDAGKPVWLYGASKQGKSSLRTTALGDRAVVVRCTANQTCAVIYERILGAFGCRVEPHGDRLRVYYNEIIAGALNAREWLCDLSSPQAVAEIIRVVGGGRYIAIEEFHYLSDDAAKQFARDLKTWIEEGCAKVVVTAAGSDPDRLVDLNRDLSSRVESISVDDWKTDDIAAVVSRGFLLIDQPLTKEVVQEIVSCASGSIFLAQRICWEVATALPRPCDIAAATLRVVRSLGSSYINGLKILAAGSVEGKNLPYRVIVRRVLDATADEIEQGVAREAIRTEALKYSCDEAALGALDRIDRLQERRGNQVLTYSSPHKRIFFTDRIFAAWLRVQDRSEVARKVKVSDEDLQTFLRPKASDRTSPVTTVVPELLAVHPGTTPMNIRILHLSDIHFGRHYFDELPIAKDTVPREDKPSIIKYLLESGISYDACVLSGDLSQTARPAEFSMAAKLVDELRKNASQKIIVDGSVPVAIVPGNHDVHWGMAKAEPDDKSIPLQYFRDFATRCGTKLHGSLPEECWSILDLRPSVPLLFLGLSSVVVESPSDHRGYIGDGQVQAAMREVRRIDPNRECLRVAVFHHHLAPVPSLEQGIQKAEETLREGAHVEAQLHEHRFSMVLHGHRHHGYCRGLFEGVVGNDLVVSGCGSSGVVLEERGGQNLELRVVDIQFNGDSATIAVEPFEFRQDQRRWIVRESGKFRKIVSLRP